MDCQIPVVRLRRGDEVYCMIPNGWQIAVAPHYVRRRSDLCWCSFANSSFGFGEGAQQRVGSGCIPAEERNSPLQGDAQRFAKQFFPCLFSDCLTMLFAGIGGGFAKILRAADHGETSAYVIAFGIAVYSTVLATYLAWQWSHRKPDQMVLALFKKQIGLCLSLVFSLWVLFEIARRLFN